MLINSYSFYLVIPKISVNGIVVNWWSSMKNMVNAIAKYIASPFLVLFSNGKYLLILFGYISHMKHAVVDISNPAMFIGDVS